MMGPGDHLGDYEIVSLLGEGGMGAVYLGRDVRLARHVALKVLPEALTRDPQRVVRFEREARAASALNHPNICTIHAFGDAGDGRRFIVMERVEGMTLRTVLGSGRLPLATALEYAIQIAAGVAAAHAQGVVHRDLKPENVIVRPDGLLKLLDFGLAKLVSDTTSDPDVLTRSRLVSEAGHIIGTVHYMSPEQARGQDVDHRTDIWSAGIILYEMVTGRLPFTGPSASDVMASVLHHEPPPLAQLEPGLPGELQRILTKCLRKDPSHRYQTVKDLGLDIEVLRDELRGAQASAAPAARPVDHPPSADDASSSARKRAATVTRTPKRILAAAGLVALMLAAAGVAWWVATREPRDTGTKTAQRATLKRLTFDAGLQTDASLSPDGRFVVYASDRSGNLDLWVQPVDGGDPVQITREPEPDVQPAWSPDGQSIAFRSERSGGGIFVMPALGGHARQLSTFGIHPRWLNQAEILFVVGNVDAGIANAAQVFVAAVDGEAPHEVFRDFLSGGGLYWAAGHPDGRISLFAAHRTLGTGFFTLSRDGRSITTSRMPASFPMHPMFLESTPTRFQWNRTGTALYLEATVEGIQNLWRVTVAPQSLEWQQVERLTTGPGRDVGASLSADGRRLAYSSITEQTRIHVLSLHSDGRTVTGSPLVATEPNAEAFLSALSHDGRRLVYTIRRSGSLKFEIRVSNLDTGESVLLDDDVQRNVHLAWSPDDSAVLHQRLRTLDTHPAADEAELVRHEPGGRETVLLPWSTKTAFLAMDGTAGRDLLGVAFRFSGEPSDIVLRATVGGTLGNPRVLLADPRAHLWEPTYSPGRRWISFVRQPADDAQRLDLMIAPADGAPPSKWTHLAPAHAWADKPRWSKDGRLLYFLSRDTGVYRNVWALPIDPDRGASTGAPFAVTHFQSPMLFVSPHVEKTAMSVANGRLALTMTSATGSLWMLDDLPTDDGPTPSH